MASVNNFQAGVAAYRGVVQIAIIPKRIDTGDNTIIYTVEVNGEEIYSSGWVDESTLLDILKATDVDQAIQNKIKQVEALQKEIKQLEEFNAQK